MKRCKCFFEDLFFVYEDRLDSVIMLFVILFRERLGDNLI